MAYHRRFTLAFFCLLLWIVLPESAIAQNKRDDIYAIDLEELLNVKVISTSKKPQSVLKSASAIHVISQDDIRRSGATTLPDVFRGVPGVQVAQIDANKWAVTIRGFNDRFAQKTLVMVDGRTIYTPLFSGVYWNMHDMVLEDIDRIEIVRGPGGALWGANAVNGVINIITKNARDTQGTTVALIGGSLERNLTARVGGKINDDTSFRLYAKGRHHENYDQLHDQSNLGPANDQWRNLNTGFRIDGSSTRNSDWMLQGGYTVGTAGQLGTSTSLTPPAPLVLRDTINYQAGNLVFLWNKYVSDDNKWRVQAYYDYFKREALGSTNLVHTVDLEIQNQRRLFNSHDVVWGIGYRSVLDELGNDFVVSFTPSSRHYKTFNAFIQDEIQLTQKLRFTAGTKIEHNDFTGFEYQPNVRLLFEINDQHSVWAAYSRAVRVPSRSSHDIRINFLALPGDTPNSLPLLFGIFGDRKFRSENINAFEMGYRSLLTRHFSVDTALFFNLYDDLGTSERSGPIFEAMPLPHLLFLSTVDNLAKANTYGAEVMTKWQVTPFWQLASSYTWFKLDGRYVKNSTADLERLFILENSDPRHQFSVRSDIQLPYNLELNSNFYYTDSLAGRNIQTQARLDLRLAWRPSRKMELAVVGQNVTNKTHQEFDSTDGIPSQIPRSIYGRILYTF
ncbi:MAG: TonB-dependent receptor [Nitrosomonas sp.]|nr:TonB-dependent receptor [Nitrosomonas sp.]